MFLEGERQFRSCYDSKRSQCLMGDGASVVTYLAQSFRAPISLLIIKLDIELDP